MPRILSGSQTSQVTTNKFQVSKLGMLQPIRSDKECECLSSVWSSPDETPSPLCHGKPSSAVTVQNHFLHQNVSLGSSLSIRHWQVFVESLVFRILTHLCCFWGKRCIFPSNNVQLGLCQFLFFHRANQNTEEWREKKSVQDELKYNCLGTALVK